MIKIKINKTKVCSGVVDCFFADDSAGKHRMFKFFQKQNHIFHKVTDIIINFYSDAEKTKFPL